MKVSTKGFVKGLDEDYFAVVKIVEQRCRSHIVMRESLSKSIIGWKYLRKNCRG